MTAAGCANSSTVNNSVQTNTNKSKVGLDSIHDIKEPECTQKVSDSSGRPSLTACVGICIIMFLSGLYMTMDSVIYVLIANEFNALSKAQWIVTSNLIAVTCLQPIYGKLSDITGRKIAVYLAAALLAIGSTLSASSGSINMLIASRVIEGFGSSGVVVMTNIIVADLLDEKSRAAFMGLTYGVSGIASIGGTALGGYLVQRSIWRVVYWINIPISIIIASVVLLLVKLPNPPPASFRDKLARIDFGGAFIMPVGIVFILLGLSWGGHDYPWASSRVICFLVIGFLVVLGFFYYEHKVPKEPIFPVRLLRTRNVAISFIGNVLLGAVIYAPFAFIPMWALIVRDAIPIVSNLYVLPFNISDYLLALITGYCIGLVGRYREFMWAGGIVLLIGVALFILFDQYSSLGEIIGVQVIAGIGAGACTQILIFAAQVASSSQDSAVVTSICIFLRSIGSVIVVAVLSSVNNNILHSNFGRLSSAYPEYSSAILSVSENQSLINSLDLPQHIVHELTKVFIKGMRGAFIALIPFSALFAISTFGFKHIPLQRPREGSPAN